MIAQSGQNEHESSMKLSGERPFGNGQGCFSRPRAVPDYVTWNLPPLPQITLHASSSAYDSDRRSYQPSSRRLHREYQPLAPNRNGRRGIGNFERPTYEDGMATVQPPNVNIMTDLKKANGPSSGGYQKLTHSAWPEPHDAEIVEDVDIHDEFGVSPLMSPLAGTFSYQAQDVSPFTPEDASVQAFGQKTSEPDFNIRQIWAARARHVPRGQPHWKRVPLPAASRSSLGSHSLSLGIPTEKTKQQPPFRYCDPGNPTATSITGARGYGLTTHAASTKKAATSTTKGAEPQNNSEKAAARKPVLDTSKDIPTSPYSMWTRGYGHGKSSTTPSSSSKVSFSVSEADDHFANSVVKGKPKPSHLHLQDGRTVDEHVKTPYPNHARPKTGWEYREEGEAADKLNASSWGMGLAENSKMEGLREPRSVGNLVSRFKHAGGDVISKLSFASKESGRGKKIQRNKRD